jgi:hypothetical protein
LFPAISVIFPVWHFKRPLSLPDALDGKVTLLHVIAASGDVLVDISGNLIETSEMDLVNGKK